MGAAAYRADRDKENGCHSAWNGSRVMQPDARDDQNSYDAPA